MNYIIQAFKALEEIDDDAVVVKAKPKKQLKESMEDYYVLSDGKNPRNSTVYPKIDNLGNFIKGLKVKGGAYYELLHYINGTPKKVWDSKNGEVKESCELKEEPKFELSPDYDSRKSFYGKAKVDVKPDGTQILYSYGTPVCKIKDGKATLLKKGYLGWASSQTTLRHVKEFLKQNGFEVGSINDLRNNYPVEQFNESIEENSQEQLKENHSVILNDKEEVQKAKEEIEDETPNDEAERIIDVDAETVDKLKDSYLGQVILVCRKCRTPMFKAPEDLKKDEDTGFYNVEDECSHCGATEGFELGGQIGTYDKVPEEDKQDGASEEQPKEEEKVEVKVKEKKVTPIKDENDISKVESFDDEKFNTLVTKYLKEVYENVDSFETKDASFDEEKVILEGVIKYTSEKTRDVKFVFEQISKTKGNKIRLSGINEDLANDKNAFSMIASVKDNALICETFSYNYKVKLDEEETLVRGRTSLKENKKDKTNVKKVEKSEN